MSPSASLLPKSGIVFSDRKSTTSEDLGKEKLERRAVSQCAASPGAHQITNLPPRISLKALVAAAISAIDAEILAWYL
jgi:hypothetical protein